MIPKRIPRKPEVRDNYSHLAEYIAAAREKGEKLDRFWIVNCDAGSELTDLETALIEIEATRAMKPEHSDRTYHLVLSFHASDLEKLSTDDLKEIERSFAEALGFGDHQRVAGTHINTDHFHMHVAINKVHPVTGRVHTPHRDFFTLSKLAREIEQKYGLVVDHGMEGRDKEKSGPSGAAKDFESKTWQQSYESHLLEHKAEILAVVKQATSWEDLHKGLAEYDAELKKRGAGLVFKQITGKRTMKASALDRSCSLKSLKDRLGPYQASPTPEKAPASTPVEPKRPYKAKPLTRHPATEKLWRNYVVGGKARPKQPGFLARTLHPRNWREYLMADAHKDMMALAVILTYKEAFHMLGLGPNSGGRPARPKAYQPPNSLKPALDQWYKATPWQKPDTPWPKDMNLEELGLKADDGGRVLFPMRDDQGHIQGIHAINGQGQSAWIGEAKPALSHVVDPDGHLANYGKSYPGKIIISANPLDAMIAHHETDFPVVVVRHPADLRGLHARLSKIHPLASLELAPRIDLTKWIADQASKGRTIHVDPDLARTMGAFEESALNQDEAKDARSGRGGPKKPSGPSSERGR